MCLNFGCWEQLSWCYLSSKLWKILLMMSFSAMSFLSSASTSSARRLLMVFVRYRLAPFFDDINSYSSGTRLQRHFWYFHLVAALSSSPVDNGLNTSGSLTQYKQIIRQGSFYNIYFTPMLTLSVCHTHTHTLTHTLSVTHIHTLSLSVTHTHTHTHTLQIHALQVMGFYNENRRELPFSLFQQVIL